jgi:hypothetical protein
VAVVSLLTKSRLDPEMKAGAPVGSIENLTLAQTNRFSPSMRRDIHFQRLGHIAPDKPEHVADFVELQQVRS